MAVCDNVMEETGQDRLPQEPITELEDPETLRRLWSRVVDPEVGVSLDTHRSYFSKYPGTFQGRRLLEWLAHHDISTSHAQGLTIGTCEYFALQSENLSCDYIDYKIFNPDDRSGLSHRGTDDPSLRAEPV